MQHARLTNDVRRRFTPTCPTSGRAIMSEALKTAEPFLCGHEDSHRVLEVRQASVVAVAALLRSDASEKLSFSHPRALFIPKQTHGWSGDGRARWKPVDWIAVLIKAAR